MTTYEKSLNVLQEIFAKDYKMSSNQSNNWVDEFYLSKQVGYRLEITATSAGSRSYS